MVLPHPLGPISPTIVARGTVKSIPSRTTSSPNALTRPSRGDDVVGRTVAPVVVHGRRRLPPSGRHLNGPVHVALAVGHAVLMRRTVSSSLRATLSTPLDVVLAVAVHPSYGASETLTVTLDGEPVEVRACSTTTAACCTTSRASARASWPSTTSAPPATASQPIPVEEIDPVRYLRPSRYCESDQLGAIAHAEFPACTGWPCSSGVELGRASTSPTSRVEPADRRRGAHPARPPGRVPRLRPPGASPCCAACDMPARLVSVYAPGLHRWTSTPSPRPSSTASGWSSMRRRSRRARRCCASPRGATRRTPPSSPRPVAAPS